MINILEFFSAVRGRVASSPLALRLLNGAFWTGIGTVASKGSTVVASFCVARFCGKTQFGEYGMVINTASMLSVICGMGMGTTVVKYVAGLKERDPERAGRILAMTTCLTWGMAIVCGLLFITFADFIAERLIAAPHLAPLLRIAALGVILGIFNEVQLASLTGCEAYQERAKISVCAGVVQSVLLILLGWLWGLKGAVIAFSIAAVITVVVTTILLIPIWRRYGLRRRFRGMVKEWGVLVGFSLPTILLLLLGLPVNWFTRTLLAKIPDGYDHLAIINAAAPWGALIVFLVTTIGTALVPIISDIIGKGERERALRLTWKMFWCNSAIVIPICIGICLFSPLILKAYGQGFETGVFAFCIVALANGLGAIYQPMWNYLVGAGMMWTNFLVVFFTAVIQIVSAYALVSRGAVGLAEANLINTVLRLMILIIVFKSIIPRCHLRV